MLGQRILSHMKVTWLSEGEADTLRAQPLSYDRPAAGVNSADTDLRLLKRSRILDRTDFDGAARDLLSWRVHASAGLRVAASDIPLTLNAVVRMQFGVGPVSLAIPCRVVEVIQEPRHRGFSYGTLPGHPEVGEERFLVERLNDGRIRFTITALSLPATRAAKLAGPLGRVMQRGMTMRYLKALDRL